MYTPNLIAHWQPNNGDVQNSQAAAVRPRVPAGCLSLSRRFQRQETYGLALQMQAAVSIPGNIDEGFHRRGKSDKARFMNVAEGSVKECRYFLILASDLGYGDTSACPPCLTRSAGCSTPMLPPFWLLAAVFISRRDIKAKPRVDS